MPTQQPQQPLSLMQVAALGVLLQVAFALLTNKRQRELMQTAAPVTSFVLVAHGAAAAAIAADAVDLTQLALVDELLPSDELLRRRAMTNAAAMRLWSRQKYQLGFLERITKMLPVQAIGLCEQQHSLCMRLV